MNEAGSSEASLRCKLESNPDDFDTLVALMTLVVKRNAIVEEEMNMWLETLRQTLDVTARQRYSLAALLFTMGRYKDAWEQSWAGMHSRGLDSNVQMDLREMIRILRDDMSSPI